MLCVVRTWDLIVIYALGVVWNRSVSWLGISWAAQLHFICVIFVFYFDWNVSCSVNTSTPRRLNVL